MKCIVLILSCFLLPLTMIGQYINPGCTDLSIEHLEMDDDTAHLVKVTVFNSCPNCTQFGCVYVELRIIRTVAPYDTMASSRCMCLISPDNNDHQTYAVHASFASVPSLNTLRVSFICGTGDGCDSLPFKTALGMAYPDVDPSIQLFPNPTTSQITIHTSYVNELSVIVTDLAGRILLSENTVHDKAKIDLSALSNGIYSLEVRDQTKRLKTFKAVKH